MSESPPAPSTSLSRALVEELSAASGEPAWLRERRLAAWEAFVRLPLPSANVGEEWRRTDIGGLDLDAFGVLPHRVQKGAAPAPLLALVGDPTEAAGLRLVVNGVQIQSRLAGELVQRGLIFTSLSEAVAKHPDLVRPYLGSVVHDDENKFRALHGALWSGGTFLYVPKALEVDLQLVTGTWLDRDGAAFLPHTLVVAEERSRVTLVEVFGSAPGASRTLVNHAVELIPKGGAQIRYVNLQDWARNLWEFGIVRMVLERDATVNSLMVAFGAGLVKTNVESRLVGQGSTSEMLGIAFGDGTQHFDYHTLQEHVAQSTTSDLLYKGVLKDKARSVFSGLIRADHGAQKTNAFQLNRNLILSEGARADSMPKLEILANDLRCTHGASTSRLNEDQIFYLMSRALPRAVAVRMMVDGFLAEIFDRIPLRMIRQRLSETVERKMGDYV
ncbi:MAG TPA: Fe-S cluster assembly protein SufD [bacterium]|nr:Fe-S cluster assembly protein SufD [bacterium]